MARWKCGSGVLHLDVTMVRRLWMLLLWGGDRIGKVLQPEQALMSKVAKKFPSCLGQGGFVNVQETKTKWLPGPWPKGKREK